MNKSKMHLVPQAVIDCAENFVSSKNLNSRAAYEARLHAVKEYCDYMLRQNPINISETIHSTKLGPKRVRK